MVFFGFDGLELVGLTEGDVFGKMGDGLEIEVLVLVKEMGFYCGAQDGLEFFLGFGELL